MSITDVLSDFEGRGGKTSTFASILMYLFRKVWKVLRSLCSLQSFFSGWVAIVFLGRDEHNIVWTDALQIDRRNCVEIYKKLQKWKFKSLERWRKLINIVEAAALRDRRSPPDFCVVSGAQHRLPGKCEKNLSFGQQCIEFLSTFSHCRMFRWAQTNMI